MDADKALAILKALASGVDPHTGAGFPTDSPYQHPDTIRALFHAVQSLETGVPKKPTAAKPGNYGKPWTQEEDERLTGGFDAGEPIDTLARTLGRSRLAIEARLARFGKVPPPPGVRLAGTPRASEQPAPYRAQARTMTLRGAA